MYYHTFPGNKSLLSEIKIMMEDSDIVVVYKPPGVLSQEDRSGKTDVYRYIKSRISGHRPHADVFLGLVHRLDRPAAGLMVMAKSKTAAADLCDQFRTHTVKKKYYAVVHGKPRARDTLIDTLEKNSRENISHIALDSNSRNKNAILTFKRIKYRNKRSLLDIDLKTGKSHQIRVQLSQRGHPIVGDRKYGSTEILKNRSMIALCAYFLEFRHPRTHHLITFFSPRPRHWPWYDPLLFRSPR